MKYFIFRNQTIETFFNASEAVFSGYDEISGWNDGDDYYIWFYSVPIKEEPQLLVAEINSYLSKLELVHSQIPSRKTFIIFTLVDLFPIQFQNSVNPVRNVIEDFNESIYELSDKYSNIKIIDFSSFTNNYSIEQLIDWKYYFISGMLLNPKLANPFRQWFDQQIRAIELRRKKCIVLDLDNTLWGGVLGEDGIEGIQIGEDYPGSAFLFFQKSLLELSKNGIILAICSKNNEKDVLEAWEKNPNILLKNENITTYRINWNNKADNIQEIAEELNIGLESFVMIDDNPEERELIKQLLPMVEVPDFPDQPYKIPVFFRSILSNYFQIYTLTNEDKNKLNQYKTNAERVKYSRRFNDLHEYLKSLEMHVTIQGANKITIPRISQLTQKTNQFNLTTKRYTESDINNFVAQGDLIYTLSVSDKFGDHGITGLIIIRKNADTKTGTIDTFLLSCRILGKGIETAFIYFILNKLKSDGMERVKSSYISTNKNAQVADYYDKIGFEKLNFDDTKNSKEYILNIKDKLFEIDTIYQMEEI